MVDFYDPAAAERWIMDAFSRDASRLRHILVIAELVRQSARDINELQPGAGGDEVLAYCAGLVHDIGYAEGVRNTGFHPLDGYKFLMANAASRLAVRIVRHSSSPEEAALLGLTLPDGVDDITARLVTYWDMQTKQGGEIVGYEERYRDILDRYGEESLVGHAHILARPRIEELIASLDRLLGKRPQG